MPRLPLTLWLATFFDLLRLVGLSASILVTVIALGACVKPLSDGVLQPQDLPKFLSIAIVPMLAYALPFAGGFAATLVYYRIAHDNEAIAAHAGGIGRRSLLFPAFVVAALMTGTLLLLNEEVIPAFLGRMQQMVTTDVVRQVMRGVEKGQAVQLKGAGGAGDSRVMIYADSAEPLTPEPSSGALEELVMHKFAAVLLDRDGQPEKEVTSELATMWLFPGDLVKDKTGAGEEARSLVYIRLENAIAVEQRNWRAREERIGISLYVPNAFIDKVSFLSHEELMALKDTPEKLNWIQGNRQRTAQALAERMVIARMRDDLSAGRAVNMLADGKYPLSLTAGVMVPDATPKAQGSTTNRWQIAPLPGKKIEVQRERGSVSGVSSESITAERATLSNDAGAGPHRLDFKLELEHAFLASRDSPAQAERALIPIESLTPVPNPLEQLLAKSTSSRELLATARQWTTPQDNLDGAPQLFDKALSQLKRLILAKQNERIAMALSCAVMVLTGAITSLLLSKKLPLTVYLFTFFPAIASMVTISGGEQATAQIGAAGLILMWSGVVAFGLYTTVVFYRVARH